MLPSGGMLRTYTLKALRGPGLRGAFFEGARDTPERVVAVPLVPGGRVRLRQVLGVPVTLADWVESRRAEIIQRWIDSVRPPLAIESLPRELLVDSLPEFIDEMLAILRGGEARGEGLLLHMGAEHGKQRFALGFDPSEMVREYSLLRGVLYSLFEESGFVPTLAEMRALSHFLDLGVANGVAEFVRVRDLQMDEQASEHLAFLAHELRNPLTSVHLALHSLSRDVPESRRRSVEVMERGLAMATDLIDSQLVELRLRAGSRPSFVEIEAREFLSDAIEGVRPNAESKGQSLALDVQTDIPFAGDLRLLRSVLRNLLGNAVKFSEEGAVITLRAKKVMGRLILEVEDRCGGLPKGMAEKMFNPYVQFGRDRSGHGLGLAIAKQAVDAHTGTIRVHDLPGKGCNFIVDLPLVQPEAVQSP